MAMSAFQRAAKKRRREAEALEALLHPLPPRPKKVGRPAHIPTKHSRTLVRVWGIMGRDQGEMAHDLKIDGKTLRKYYAPELHAPRAIADAQVVETGYMMATGGGDWKQAVPQMTLAWMRSIGWVPEKAPTYEQMVVNPAVRAAEERPRLVFMTPDDAKL
jgi:hypothetical protein